MQSLSSAAILTGSYVKINVIETKFVEHLSVRARFARAVVTKENAATIIGKYGNGNVSLLRKQDLLLR